MSGGVPAGELLPCPFCDGPAVNVAGEYISCGAPAFLTCAGRSVRADAEDWNTRATPTPPIEGRDADVERDVRVILQAVADADSEDCIGSIDVDIPKGGYPRQWLREAARAALQALGERG